MHREREQQENEQPWDFLFLSFSTARLMRRSCADAKYEKTRPNNTITVGADLSLTQNHPIDFFELCSAKIKKTQTKDKNMSTDKGIHLSSSLSYDRAQCAR